jgi:hypothetical protein
MSVIKIASGCLNLVQLDLSYCGNFTDMSVIRIAESCPNLLGKYLYVCRRVCLCVCVSIYLCVCMIMCMRICTYERTHIRQTSSI